MRKDYSFNTYESVDFELNDCGTSEFSLRFDRMLNFLFSDVELYSDSGRTVPLSAADWEYYTTDTVYTTKEGAAGGSGKTIYSQIKVVNATYQTGTLYGTCNNFGSYASGNAQGPDFQEITATGSYTIDPQIKEAVLDASATTSTITITISGGTHPSGNAGIMNRVKIVGSDTVKTIVTDGTLSFWVEPGQVVDFYLKGTTLVWASGASELVYDVPGNTPAIPAIDMLRGFPSGRYEVYCSTGDPVTGTNSQSVIFRIESDATGNSTSATLSASGNVRAVYNYAGDSLDMDNVVYNIKKVRYLHNAS